LSALPGLKRLGFEEEEDPDGPEGGGVGEDDIEEGKWGL
jgi:hypothetical protein